MKQIIVFYALSDSIKAKIVFNQIKINNNFKNYDKILITDKDKNYFNLKFKKTINYLEKKKIDNLLKKNIFLIISLGWDKKIKSNIINKNKFKIINCHSGILPMYKGLALYRHCWAHFENEFGVTIHFIDKKIDNGKIIYIKKFKVSFFDSPKKILIKASEITYIALIKSIKKLDNNYKGKKQKKGRYFLGNITFNTMIKYRIYNFFSKISGNKKKYLPFKRI